jgi:prevent-host-death family protein
MKTVNIYEAKTHLSSLVQEVCTGSEVTIAKDGKPLAKLVPIPSKGGRKFKFGDMKGKIEVADDFDDPLPEEIIQGFEGE